MANKLTVQVTTPVTLDNNRLYGRGAWNVTKDIAQQLVGREAGEIVDEKEAAKIAADIEKSQKASMDSDKIGSRVKNNDDPIAKNDTGDSVMITDEILSANIVKSLAESGITTVDQLKEIIAAEDGKEQLDAIDGLGEASIKKIVLAVQESE